tara:strand:- start:213 stop:389 length:177 start_codon:yes stop_codon:yes gene_type:complete
MKKYTLTIKYDENSDTVEWIQEEIIEEESTEVTSFDDISNLTIEDMLLMKEGKEYPKA